MFFVVDTNVENSMLKKDKLKTSFQNSSYKKRPLFGRRWKQAMAALGISNIVEVMR